MLEEEVNFKCWKLLQRDSPSSRNDWQLRENRAIAIDKGTEKKFPDIIKKGRMVPNH